MLVIGGKDNHEQNATHLSDRLGITPVVVPEMKRAIQPGQDRIAYKKVKALIQEFKPDVVHTHAAKSGAIGRLAAVACNVPVVVHTFHGHVFHSYFSPLKTRAFIQIERYLAARSSGIIAISDIQKQELAQTYRICPAEKISVIPLGLDLDRFAEDPCAKRSAFRVRYGIVEDEVAIGIIGRIVPVKNHSLFVAAAARVLAATGKKLRFIVIGDGDARASMEAEWKAVGMDYTYFPDNPQPATALCTSWQTEMDEVIAGLDIVALTSHNEGTPVSLIEAQAAAKPVVSTAVGGVADVVEDGCAGYVTPPGDVEAFSNALLQLVEDPRLRARFGAAGRAAVMTRFSYQRLVSDMDAYYRRLLSARER
jgi:glycosyltransferase involved in cell wall biosynthesis